MLSSLSNRSLHTVAIVFVALLVASSIAVPALASPTGAATATTTSVSLSPSSSSLDVGDTTTVDIVVDDAPDGVDAYEFDVSLSNGSVADITSVTHQGDPLFPDTSYGADNDSVTVSGGGASFSSSSPTVVTLELTGTEGGSTDVQLSTNKLQDQDGNDYTISSSNDGSLSVAASTKTVPVVGIDGPGTVQQGQTAWVNATVKNTASASAEYQIDLQLDGATEETTNVTLAAGETKTPSFDIDTSGLAAGVHSYTVQTLDDSDGGDFLVEDPNPTATVSVVPADVSTSVGEKTTLAVVADAPNGLQGWEATLTVANATVANISSASLSDEAAFGSTDINADNSSVSMNGGNFNPRPAGDNLTLAYVTVDSSVAGETDLTLSGLSVSDRNNDQYEIGGSTDGHLTVAASTQSTASARLSPETTSTTVGDTTTIDVLANASEGTQGWMLTLELANGSVANITDATLTPDPALGEVNISTDNNSVELEAGYLSPRSGSENITLATVTLTGAVAGETTLDLTEVSIRDDENQPYEITGTTNSTVTVNASSEVEAPTVPGGQAPAANVDDDPLLEDVNGDGTANIFDAITYYNARTSSAIADNPDLFDFDGSGEAGSIFDAIALYNDIK